MLEHIISKDGVKVDPEKIEDIKKIPFPKNVKYLQYFNGHVNFIRRFIPNLEELMKPTHNLLKKNATFEWTNEGQEAFRCINDAITRSLVLVSPDYSKYFLILSFSSESTIAGVLLQQNNEGYEKPIAFMI